TFILAFVVVLALIGGALWLIRRFANNRLCARTQRGRMPRLAAIDAAAVDGPRRLVLVRRDNVEHLLMIGGPSDIVVEPNIVRAAPGRDQLPPRPAVASPDMKTRIHPVPAATGWLCPPPTCRPASPLYGMPPAGVTAGPHPETHLITASRKGPNRRRARR